MHRVGLVGVVHRVPQDQRAGLALSGVEIDPLTGNIELPGTCDGCGYRAAFLVSMGIGGWRCPSCRREARKHHVEITKES